MKRRHQTDQAGMVAIIITMIMMFVITLIVIGFSEVTRRNQNEALNTQLATQAFYAAETGVNDVVNLITKDHVDPQAMISSNCGIGTYNSVGYPRALKGTDVVNTCLMVDPNPNSLIADTVEDNTGTVVWDVKNHNAGVPFTNLTFSWAPDPSIPTGPCTASPGATTYPVPSQWKCTYALLRVDMIPASPLPSLDATSLAAATKTLYLKPTTGPTAVTLGGTSAYQGSCKPSAVTNTCSVQVTTSASEYYVRITSQYVTAKNVTLTGNDSFGRVKFENGQVVVDSTGRAQNQVKRIRVRVPLGQASDLPVFGLQSAGTICKNVMVNNLIPYYTAGQCKTPIWPGATN